MRRTAVSKRDTMRMARERALLAPSRSASRRRGGVGASPTGDETVPGLTPGAGTATGDGHATGGGSVETPPPSLGRPGLRPPPRDGLLAPGGSAPPSGLPPQPTVPMPPTRPPEGTRPTLPGTPRPIPPPPVAPPAPEPEIGDPGAAPEPGRPGIPTNPIERVDLSPGGDTDPGVGGTPTIDYGGLPTAEDVAHRPTVLLNVKRTRAGFRAREVDKYWESFISKPWAPWFVPLLASAIVGGLLWITDDSEVVYRLAGEKL